MKTLSCFVISPIGDKGTEIRKAADDLLELIIEPSLDKYQFHIERADKISAVSAITSDIIKRIQEADLCIIDVTNQNANVMYECGRRHETGKPYIMLAHEGEKLPFDINIIRTIFYNLDKPREVRETIVLIQKVIENLLIDGFYPQSSGENLSTISETLKRIERKLDGVTNISNTIDVGQSLETEEIIKTLGVRDAFKLALRENNIPFAEKLLNRISSTVNHSDFIEYYVEVLCTNGSFVAYEILKMEVNKIDDYSINRQQDIIGSIVQFFLLRDLADDGIKFLSNYFDTVRTSSFPDQAKVFFLNQQSRLEYSSGNYQKAIEIGLEVITYEPENIYYLHNLALCYSSNNELDKAVMFIEKCLTIEKEKNEFSSDHIVTGINIYKKNGNKSKYNELLQLLKDVNPLKYRVVV